MPPIVQEPLEEADAQGKPAVLVFTPTWCQLRQQMKQITFLDHHVASLLGHCVVVEIDTGHHPARAKAFEVVGLPDIRLRSPDGTTKHRLLGFQTPQQFAETLDGLREVHSAPRAGSQSPGSRFVIPRSPAPRLKSPPCGLCV